MKKMILALMALATLVVFDAQAHRRGKEETAHAVVVATLISEEGESREAFVRRLAGFMQGWTDENKAEICGWVGTDGSRWGVKLITHYSQLTCIMDRRVLPEGFVAEADNIHSHPRPDQRDWMMLTDKTIAAARAMGDRLTVNRVQIKHGFSDDDFITGSGFLVANDELFYQNGRHGIQKLGKIN